MSRYHRAIAAMGQGWESLPPDIAEALRLYFEQHIHLPPDAVRRMLELRGAHPELRTPPGTAYRLLTDVGEDGLRRLIGRDPGDAGTADITYSEPESGARSASSWTMDPSALAQISWDVTGGEGRALPDAHYAVVAADTGGNAGFMLDPDAFGGHRYDHQREVLSSGPVAARIAWTRTEAFDPESWHWGSEDEQRAWEELDMLPEGAEEDIPPLPDIVEELLGELEPGRTAGVSAPARREMVKEWRLRRQIESNETPGFDEVLDELKGSDGWSHELEWRADRDGADPDDEEWLEATEDEIAEEQRGRYDDLIREMGDLDGEECWREITLRPGVDPAGLAGVGEYWADDPGAAEAHWGDFRPGSRKVTLRARIDQGHIDRAGMVHARMDMSSGDEEREVRFLKHAPIWVYDATLDDGTVVEINDWRRA